MPTARPAGDETLAAGADGRIQVRPATQLAVHAEPANAVPARA
ncbi:hypothetical protein [Streptomyces sp. NPDC021096]